LKPRVKKRLNDHGGVRVDIVIEQHARYSRGTCCNKAKRAEEEQGNAHFALNRTGRGGRRQDPIRADHLRRAMGLSMFGLLD
jgi:hypothetical protein